MKKFILSLLKIDIILFALGLMLPDFFIRYFTGLGISKLPIVYNLFFVCCVVALISLLPKKIRKIVEIILVAFASFYGFAQTVHYAFFSTFFSFKKLTVVNELMNVSNEIIIKLKISHLIFVLPILIVIAGICIKKEDEKSYLPNITICALAIVLAIGSYMVCDKKIKSTRDESWLTDYYLFQSFHNKTRYLDRFGEYCFIYTDINKLINKNESTITLTNEESKEVDEFINSYNTIETNEKTGIYKDKNLIVILAESLNIRDVDEELMPNLYRLYNSGYFFDNYYAPIYQSATGDTEFISQTSMIPSVDFGTTSYTFHFNAYPYSLANLLSDAGYNTNSYHSYISNFYNREMFHDSLGFTTFFDIDKLGLRSDSEYFIDGTNWVDDYKLFDATINNTNTKEKFFDFVITTSGHTPYVRQRDELKENLEVLNSLERYDDYSEEAKCYLAAQMNLDEGLGTLFARLEEEGVLEDTIIVLYGDHYPYGINSEEAYQSIIKETDYQKNKVPFVIYDSTKGNQETIHTLGSTFDIYPTLCNLFGLDTKGYMVGRDLFESTGHKVIFMDRSVLTDDFYYDANSGNITYLTENKETTDEVLNEIDKIFNYGQKILTADYYDKN